jgi:hypothetical protein
MDNNISENKIILEFWEIYICDDWCSRDFKKIIEIYIPEFELSLNTDLDPVNIIKSSRKRYNRDENVKDASGFNPKLLKTEIINKSSDIGQAILWFNEMYNSKKEKEIIVSELFKYN